MAFCNLKVLKKVLHPLNPPSPPSSVRQLGQPVKPTKSSKPPIEPNKSSELKPPCESPMAKQKVNEKAKKWAFYLRQKNVTEKAAGIDSINIEVDKYDVKKPLKQQYWVNGLTETDRALLVSGRWLNDRLVNASQQLLSQQFLHLRGLQDVVMGRTLAFKIETEEFVQILHTGHGHWLTISTIGCKANEVHVFDCMPPAPTADMLNQIAAILCTPQNTITVNYIDVQMQEGYSECGTYAIAFATALAYGEQPWRCYFKQGEMRTHLQKCLEEQCITMFPVKRRRNGLKVKSTTSLLIHCECRMPEISELAMIECSKCKTWYHIDVCVSVPSEALESSTEWFCNSCTSAEVC